MFTMASGSQWTPTEISAGTCLAHCPYMFFIKEQGSEVAKCNNNTKSVWQSK